MTNLLKSALILFLIIALQLIVHILMVKPIIATWGASDSEITMPMAGDRWASSNISTRAVTIDSPKSEVWKWVNQLGADRAGFFSYIFLENMLGYIAMPFDLSNYDFKPLVVGDVVRGSIDKDKSAIVFGFPVLDVVPDDSFVLENWGTFKVTRINDSQSRLIVRTQDFDQNSGNLRMADIIGLPDHYIMERRMLLGIKERAEGKKNCYLSSGADILWFAGVVLSAFSICVLIVIFRGVQSILIPVGLGILWMFTVLVINPIPQYSLGLLVLVVTFFFSCRTKFMDWKYKIILRKTP